MPTPKTARVASALCAVAVVASGCVQRAIPAENFGCVSGECRRDASIGADADADAGADVPGSDAPDAGVADGGEALDLCTAGLALEAGGAVSDFIEVGSSVVARVTTDPALSGRARVLWELSPATSVFGDIDADGRSEIELPDVARGRQTLRARLVVGARQCDTVVATEITACDLRLVDGFTDALSEETWLIQGDASWDTTGIVSLNPLAPGQKGSLIARDEIAAGDVSLRFSARVGLGSGADGLAATLIRLASPEATALLAGEAASGDGMGYAAGGAYGAYVGDAVTLELDTFFNTRSATHDQDDPTPLPHLQITEGVDPNRTVSWSVAEQIGDYAWHAVRLDVVGSRVRAYFDGQLLIDATRAGGDFTGGYLFFSASTGGANDFHDIDDVRVYDSCR